MKRVNAVTSLPDVSVALCTYNRARILERTLKSLMRQDASDISFEIVVVDDGSTDATAEVVTAASTVSPVTLRYVWQPNSGVGIARNRAVSEALAPWIAFIDDDELAPRQWLHGLVSIANSTGADCVGGYCRLKIVGRPHIAPVGTIRKLLGENAAMRGDAKNQSLSKLLRLHVTRSAIPGGGNALVRKELIDRLGGFRRISVGEDMDFFRRAERAGARFATAVTRPIYHLIPSDRVAPRRLFALAKRGGATLAQLDRLHFSHGRQYGLVTLRIIHACLFTLPTVLLHAARSERSQLISTLCSLHFAAGYIWDWSCNIRLKSASHKERIMGTST